MDFCIFAQKQHEDEVIRVEERRPICMTKKKSLKSANSSAWWLMEAREPDVNMGIIHPR